MQYFKSAYRLDSDSSDALLGIAICNHNMGNIEEAEKLYAECLRKWPKQSEVLANYGNFMFESGDIRVGDELYKRAMELRGDDISLLYNYARNLVLYTNRLDKGLGLARRIAAINPAYPPVYPLMAEIYIQMDDLIRAERWIQRGLEQIDKDDDSYYLLKLKKNELDEKN